MRTSPWPGPETSTPCHSRTSGPPVVEIRIAFVIASPLCPSRSLRLAWGSSDFSRGRDVLEMLSETVFRTAVSSPQVLGKTRLLAIAAPFAHALELASFGLAVSPGGLGNLVDAVKRQEQHAVLVRDHVIVA